MVSTSETFVTTKMFTIQVTLQTHGFTSTTSLCLKLSTITEIVLTNMTVNQVPSLCDFSRCLCCLCQV